MTDEKLLRANEIKRKLEIVEGRITLIANMEENHVNVSLYNSEIGSVMLTSDIRDEVLGIVLNNLLAQAEGLRKEYQEL